jgi:putative ABC transport system permease protein
MRRRSPVSLRWGMPMPEELNPTRSRARISADNREEIESWIDERAARLIAGGISADDARRRAREEFGDVETASRYAERQDFVADQRLRLVLWLEECAADLRIAVRTLARTPTVTAVVLLTFAVGIGATTAVFSVVQAMLIRRLPYGNEESLVYLPPLDNGVVGLNARHSAAALVALRERTTSFSGIVGVESGNYVIAEGGDPEQVMGSGLTANAFHLLQAGAAIGRTFGPADEEGSAPSVVVLTDAFWRRRFGADSSVVGRFVALTGERHRVIGVMPPGFRAPKYEAAEFLTLRRLDNILRNPTARHVRFLRLFGRVKPGLSRRVVQADVDRTMRSLQRELPQWYDGVDTRVVPIRTAVAGDAKPRLLALMGAAVFVLLIACANVAGVLLSRALARRHELSIRVALGAGRRRLIRQFLAEGTALAVLGAVLGLLVAQAGVVTLRRVAANALPPGTSFALEPTVLLFAVLAAVLCALSCSLVPAWKATQVQGMLRRDDVRTTTPSRGTRRLRLALVAGQLAVSVVLLVGAGLLVRTMQRIWTLDLGYSTEQALTFRLQFTRPRTTGEQDAFWATLYERLRGIPGVVAVGGGNVAMSGQSTTTALAIENRPLDAGRLPDVRYSVASDDYFAALGVPILRGRSFKATDRDGAARAAVVSASLARQLWPDGNALGARIRVGPEQPWTTIVGIVGDVRMGSADPPRPSVYTSQRQDHWPGGGAVVVRANRDPTGLIASVRQAVKDIDSSLPIVGLKTLEEFRSSTPAIAERRLQLQLMLGFALIALAVSAIGVYGVTAYAMEERRHEFGIRMALGSSRRGVLWLALSDGARVAAIGAGAGIPLALLLASRLRELLYSTSPFDPRPTGIALAALLLVAFAASLASARRATLIDPARAMRAE